MRRDGCWRRGAKSLFCGTREGTRRRERSADTVVVGRGGDSEGDEEEREEADVALDEEADDREE